jgi:hypothetical protein
MRIRGVLLTIGVLVGVITVCGTVTAQDGPTGSGSFAEAIPAAGWMGADGDDASAIPNGFGIQDSDISVIPFHSFFPISSSYGYEDGPGGTYDRYNTDYHFLYAAITRGDVPNGAIITQIMYYVRDNNASIDFQGGYCRWLAESGTGANYSATCTYGAMTSGAPGDTWCAMTPGVTMKRRYDIEPDGDIDVVGWTLITDQNGALDGSITLHFVRIIWKRQITPAPMVATFSDVPVGAFGFQHIEALVDSGITAGCGGGNFCPNDTLTRAQMAIFLAKALGLHWPSGLGF